MTSPFHFFDQRDITIPPVTTAWQIPATGDGYQVMALDVPTIGAGGVLLDEPFFTQYEGSFDVVLPVECELETRLVNCHILPDGSRFSSQRIRRDQALMARQTIVRLNDFSSVSRVRARSYRSVEGEDLVVTPELAQQAIGLQIVLEFRAYDLANFNRRIATQIDSATTLAQPPKVAWWQFRAPVSPLGLAGDPPVIPEYIDYSSWQDPNIWAPWPEGALAQGTQLGTLSGIKDHLSVEHAEDDDLLMGLLDTARGYVADYARMLTVVSTSGVQTIWFDPDYTRRLRLPGPVVPNSITGLAGIQSWVEPQFPHDGYVVLPENYADRVELGYQRSWRPFYGDAGPRRLITTIYRVAGALYLYREATMAGDRAIQQLVEGALGIRSDVRL